MGDEVINEVEKRCDMVNEALIKHGLWAMTTSFTPEASYVPKNIVVVILPWEEHKKRIIEKSAGKNYDGGAKATEAGFDLVLNHRKWAQKVAKEKTLTPVEAAAIKKAADQKQKEAEKMKAAAEKEAKKLENSSDTSQNPMVERVFKNRFLSQSHSKYCSGCRNKNDNWTTQGFKNQYSTGFFCV